MGFFISNTWRWPKVIIGLFVLELLCAIPSLALFAIADPNLYRKRLWEDGNKNGFNSSPNTRLLSLANYQPVEIPILWSQFLTTFNFVISIVSLFLLLVKAVMFVMNVWWPLLSVIIHGGLTALWAWSVWAQSSPDMSEPSKPQPGLVWYLAKSCDVAYYKTNIGYCMQAKACFAITIVVMSLFALNTAWAIFSLIPTKSQREKRKTRKSELKQLEAEEAEIAAEEDLSSDAAAPRSMMQRVTGANEFSAFHFKNDSGDSGAPLRSPVTPRTQAFNTLGGSAGEMSSSKEGSKLRYTYA